MATPDVVIIYNGHSHQPMAAEGTNAAGVSTSKNEARIAKDGLPRGGRELARAVGVRRRARARPHSRDVAWLLGNCSAQKVTHGGVFAVYDGAHVPPLEKQTYRQWKSLVATQRLAHPLRMRRRVISLQPITHKSASSGYTATDISLPVLARLKGFCEAFFTNTLFEVLPPFDIADVPRLTSRVHGDTQREQFLVGDLLRYLKTRRPRHVLTIVGVTLVDLYPGPQWNFVMGHALLTGGCAIISFGRYFNTTAAANRGGRGRAEEEEERRQLRHMWILMRVSYG